MRLIRQITNIARAAKEASAELAGLSRRQKDDALLAMASALSENAGVILKANQKDISAAKKAGFSSALIDRLTLTEKRLGLMADSLRRLAGLGDPVGRRIDVFKRPNGLIIRKVSVPFGVIAIIYESRPNVTSDCAGLCLKSGNAVILRGGKEALSSNLAVFSALDKAARRCGIPAGALNLIDSTDRRVVRAIVGLAGTVDLVMPRGGEGLIKEVMRYARVPVIKHYKGVCHTYVDKAADLKTAEEVAFNAKVQRPGVCNAMETLLAHKAVAERFLPVMCRRLKDAGVQIRGCEKTRKLAPGIKRAKESDWPAEYLDLILAVKVVPGLEEAIAHINKYGSGHSDAIITEDKAAAARFLAGVDSACVYVNASTRFTDGGEFGFGAEAGISTEKLHARGPVALQELTTYKYHIIGNGQVRE